VGHNYYPFPTFGDEFITMACELLLRLRIILLAAKIPMALRLPCRQYMALTVRLVIAWRFIYYARQPTTAARSSSVDDYYAMSAWRANIASPLPFMTLWILLTRCGLLGRLFGAFVYVFIFSRRQWWALYFTWGWMCACTGCLPL
jgi:hypothetical protein